MSEETELKLLVPEHPDLSVQDLPALKPVQRRTFNLVNRYFDTPDHQLTSAGIALRLRFHEGQWLQTLKGKDSSGGGGLHKRSESEMPVAGEALELDRFPAGALPDDIDLSALRPLFETNFERHEWGLYYGTAAVELVWDQGHVITNEGRAPLSEVELELKTGPANALFDLAEELARDMPMLPSDISKAERGFRLLRQQRDWPPKPARDAPLADWLNAVCRQLEALPSSSSDLAASLQGLTRVAPDGKNQLGIVQSATAGLAADAQAWHDLPDSKALGLWLIRQSRAVWEHSEAA